MPGAFLTIRHIADRWDCGLTTVYRQIESMRAAGYMKVFYPGAKGKGDQRISVESIEMWERLHGDARYESRSDLAKLRRAMSKKKPAVPKDDGLDKLRDAKL